MRNYLIFHDASAREMFSEKRKTSETLNFIQLTLAFIQTLSLKKNYKKFINIINFSSVY
jgi:hypothetical protein